MEVSSGEPRGEGQEEVDPEKTQEEVGETSPLSKAEILCALPDDAEADAYQGGRGNPSSRRRVGRRWWTVVPPPPQHLLGLDPVLPPHRMAPPEPKRLPLRPRCCQASSFTSGRWSTSRWTGRCLELRLIPASTRYFLTLALD